MDASKRRTRFTNIVYYGCLVLFVILDVIVFVLSFTAHREAPGFLLPTLDNLFHIDRARIAHERSPHQRPQFKRSQFFMSFDDDETSGKEADDVYCQVVDTFGCVAVEQQQLRPSQREADVVRWIRVEKDSDPTIQTIVNSVDVRQAMEQAKHYQSQYGEASLYPRHWMPRTSVVEIERNSSNHVNGLERNVVNREFSVLQFNALAEGLSSGPLVQRPFLLKQQGDQQGSNVTVDKSVYGGFTAIPNPSVALDFSLRRWRILEVVLGSNCDSNYSLIALQEIDRYQGFFLPILRLFGYEGLFVPKPRSPGLSNGWYSDGCCLFWKRGTFQLLFELRREYEVGNQVYIVATLRHVATKRVVLVAVTHLKAQKGPIQEKVRCHQIDELLDEISKQSRILLQQGETAHSVLVLGDFNAEPPTSANTADDSAVRRVLNFGVDTSEGKMPMRSAYDLDLEGFYTTWKIRGSNATRRIIDYIFYSGSLSCRAALQVPSETQLDPTKLPGLRHPSDHMMIAAKFRLE